MNLKQDKVDSCDFFGMDKGNYEFERVFLNFSESGAYNRAVLTLKVMGFEVVLTIEVMLTIERSYNRVRTVVLVVFRHS